eukprot:Gregarina_sp_Poly_1__4101@NODE_224_length_11220_cov_343_477450_g198_i0_p3_GENE_NODE_224_length_11220_cov_343_477450_g198_i0NODE_224_length_11220_cov_343_477450_g198_i0_p3_ORF_typecomplete_len604_score95_06_NODE_224_length_11220_cov_343_477450_g198_i024144225
MDASSSACEMNNHVVSKMGDSGSAKHSPRSLEVPSGRLRMCNIHNPCRGWRGCGPYRIHKSPIHLGRSPAMRRGLPPLMKKGFPPCKCGGVTPSLFKLRFSSSPQLHVLRLCLLLGKIPFREITLPPQEWRVQFGTSHPTATTVLGYRDQSLSDWRPMILLVAQIARLWPVSPELRAKSWMLFHWIEAASKFGGTSNQEIPQTLIQLNAQVKQIQKREGYLLRKGAVFALEAAVAGVAYHWQKEVGDETWASWKTQVAALEKAKNLVFSQPPVMQFFRKQNSQPDLLYIADSWESISLIRWLDLQNVRYSKHPISVETWQSSFQKEYPILPVLLLMEGDVSGLHACLYWAASTSPHQVAIDWVLVWQWVETIGDLWQSAEVSDFRQRMEDLDCQMLQRQNAFGFLAGSRVSPAETTAVAFYETTLALEPGLASLRTARHQCAMRSFLRETRADGATLRLVCNERSGVDTASRHMCDVGSQLLQVETNNDVEEPRLETASGSITGIIPVLTLVAEVSGFLPDTLHGRTVADMLASAYLTERVASSEEAALTLLESLLQKYRSCASHIVQITSTWIDVFIVFVVMNGEVARSKPEAWMTLRQVRV